MKKEKKTFEAMLDRLAEIAEKLQEGDTTLEESLSLYEEGVAIVRECNLQLDQAKQKVQMITAQKDGTFVATDFTEESDES